MHNRSLKSTYHTVVLALFALGWFTNATAQELEQTTEEKSEIGNHLEEQTSKSDQQERDEEQEKETKTEPSIRGTTESDSPPGKPVDILISI
jgi:Tfp pilus assembly protein PilN